MSPNMTKQRWTFVCVPEDKRTVRQFSVSARALHYAPSLTAAVVTVLSALAVIVAMDGLARFEVAKLRGEKAAIAQAVESIRTRVGLMEGSIDGLIENDEKFRVVAGLSPIDAEIFEVGVGGPGMTTPVSSPMWETDPVTAEAVFAVAYDLSALERRATLLSESMAQAMQSLLANYSLLEAMPSILPAQGMVSSQFTQARLHPIYHEELPHVGIDLSAVVGTPILSAARGYVSYVGWKSGYGLTVEVDHGFGIMTRYAHSSQVLVERGQAVERNEILARVGRTGTATASHLHYEVWVDGEAKDPRDYILNGVIP
jgi:murein DD-endopeptidase MepM/ murein hydrolase activator NlpD